MQSEKNKICYIIGAGASANALPTVRANKTNIGFSNALRQLSEKLKNLNLISAQERDAFVDELNWLADKSDEHGSPDTYVKYCCIRKDDFTVAKIKRTLSIYFTIEQIVERNRDRRYLQFITKVIDTKVIFPGNIKILNWNYDFQFQIAAEIFKSEQYSFSNSLAKHSPPLIPYYPMLGRDFHINEQKDRADFSLIHLNGIAGFYLYQQNHEINFIQSYFMNNALTKLDDIFYKHRLELHKKSTLLTFAFDTQTYMNRGIRNRLEYAKNSIVGVDYLVIIGYSFPIDNIEVDNQIFSVLKSENLKEIFYQDPYNDGSFLYNTFDIDKNIKITHISNVDEFYIPRQFKLSKTQKNDNLKSLTKTTN